MQKTGTRGLSGPSGTGVFIRFQTNAGIPNGVEGFRLGGVPWRRAPDDGRFMITSRIAGPAPAMTQTSF